MSDDLISRKALIEELREIMNEPHNVMFLMGIGAAVSIIEHRTAAFDKEKVIEKLERAGQECTECNDTGGAEAIEYAVEIVEEGGIE